MTTILNLDLIWTDIDVFLDHFRDELNGNPDTFVADMPASCRVFRLGEEYPEGVTMDDMERDGWVLIQESNNVHNITITAHGFGESNPLQGEIWTLGVTRYRNDRLRLVFVDFSDSGSHASRFRAWLQPRWHDGITDLPPGDVLLPKGNDSPSERDANAGALNRVAEAHRLMKEGGMGKADACKRAHTDPRTYERRCREATGEPPYEP